MRNFGSIMAIASLLASSNAGSLSVNNHYDISKTLNSNPFPKIKTKAKRDRKNTGSGVAKAKRAKRKAKNK